MAANLPDELAAAVAGPDEAIDLAHAALLIARTEYPELDATRWLGVLDRWGLEAEERAGGAGTLEAAGRVAVFVFGELGFEGNREEYYDPRNSFLNDVIGRRKGIPITLTVVLIEVGRRAGVPFAGVGFPGHFLAKAVADEDELFFDPFNGGVGLGREELVAGIADTFPVERLPQFLAAVTKRQILLRMLTNLKFVYLEAKDFLKATTIVDLMLAISPWDLDQVRDRGLIARAAGRLQQAYDDFTTYVRYRPDAQDAEWIHGLAQEVRRESL